MILFKESNRHKITGKLLTERKLESARKSSMLMKATESWSAAAAAEERLEDNIWIHFRCTTVFYSNQQQIYITYGRTYL